MIPTTPNGTRTWRSWSPLASVEPRTHLADGVGQPGDLAQALGHALDPRACRAGAGRPCGRGARRTRRLRRPRRWPPGSASTPASRASAIASSAASLVARVARASSVAAARAAVATALNAPCRPRFGHGVSVSSSGLAAAASQVRQARCAAAPAVAHVLLEDLEADDLPPRQVGRLAVLVPHPHRERGDVEHGLALVPELDLGGVARRGHRVQELVLLAESLHGSAHDQRLHRVTREGQRHVPVTHESVQHASPLRPQARHPARVSLSDIRTGAQRTDNSATKFSRSRTTCAQSSDEVVAVHDLALVRRTELAGQLPGGPAEQAGQLGRVVVDQPAGDHPTGLVDQVDRVAGDEGAGHAGDAGRQQRGAPLGHRAHGPGVEHDASLGLGGVRQPEQPGRATAAGRVEQRAGLGALERGPGAAPCR